MQVAPITRKSTVIALADPHPKFVSLVTAGANQTPFRSVKDDSPVENLQPGATSDQVSTTLARIVFHSEQFATEKSVTDWLTAGGYENYDIEATDAGFVVTDKSDTEKSTDGLRLVSTGAGVDVYILPGEAGVTQIAAVAATIDDGGPNATSSKDDTDMTTDVSTSSDSTLAVKFESWMCRWTTENTLAGALADGFDGVPLGMDDVTDAFYGALRTCVRSNDTAGVSALCTELSSVIVKLMAIFPAPDEAEKSDTHLPDRNRLADFLVSSLKGVPAVTTTIIEPEEKGAPAATANGVGGKKKPPVLNGGTANDPNTAAAKNPPADSSANAPTTKTEPTTPEAAVATDTVTAAEAVVTEPVAAPVADVAKTTEKTTESAPDAMQAALVALTGAVGVVAEAVKSLTAVTTAVKADTATLAGRVDGLESGRQSRKGADIGVVVAAGNTSETEQTTAQKNDEFMRRARLGGFLGLRTP